MASTSVGHAVHGSASTTRVMISDSLRAVLEACPPAARKAMDPTEEQRAAILEYWGKIRQADLAKALGVCRNTLARWHEEISRG
jgi:hypothetical protein